MKRQVIKRSLLLSAASVALLSGPALSDPPLLDITTVTKTAVATSTAVNNAPGDITIESGGTITIGEANAAVTLNSNNTVTHEGTITNQNTTGAEGILIDTGANTTPATITGSLLDIGGTINLTGSGTGKEGVLLQGNGTFVGNISLLSTTFNIQGDGSSAVSTISTATLNGNMEIGGTITMTPTTANETTSTGISAINLAGPINGSVTIDSGSTIVAYGEGSQGFVSTGTISGSFTNFGTLATSGFQSTTNSSTGVESAPTGTSDPAAGSAVAIGGSILGGFLNAGPDGTGSAITAATISMNGGLGAGSPAVLITPALQASPTALEIGVYTGDLGLPGYSFYNRGSITAGTIDPNLDVGAVTIGGISATVNTKLDGLGILNSGSITAAATTTTTGTSVPTATAIAIGNYVQVGDPTNPASGLYNTAATGGGGMIEATVSGALGGNATALSIGTNSNLNSIYNYGTIAASVSTTNPTTVLNETATAISDQSGTLKYITNLGLISATATPLTSEGQVTVAADLSHNSTGVTFTNGNGVTSASVVGDIRFGSGADTLSVVGTADTASTISGNIAFGGVTNGGFDTLNVGSYSSVSGQINEVAPGMLNVNVSELGTLNVQNNSPAAGGYGSLLVNNLQVANNGTLNVAVSTVLPNNTSINAGAAGTITLAPGANLGVIYSSFVPSSGQFVLMQAATGNLDISTAEFAQIKTDVDSNIPFLFTGSGLARVTTPTVDQIVLNLTPKTSSQLGLTGYAAQVFPYANAALATDDTLGAGMISGITNNAQAQTAYSQLAPDASGGTRAIVISLTDPASGPVAARQRELGLYASQPGELTLWGQEFAEQINDKGDNDLPGFKDAGFGFALGADGGDPLGGWYGGAFTFYTGNVDQQLPASSRDNTQWYMLTGYSTWRGKGLFFDTQATAGYGDLSAHRFIDVGDPATTGVIERQADGKRSSILAAGGVTTGANLVYGSTTITPNISFDGLTMREEGYTETGGGPGFDLQVDPVLMSSARAAAGLNARQDINFGDFFMQPELRVGYRYDFLADKINITAQFPSLTGTTGPGTGAFTITGFSPTRGNVLAGASLAVTTGAWSIGVNYDMLSGSNGSMTQVGTMSLIGRI